MTSDLFLSCFLAIVLSSHFLDAKLYTRAPSSVNQARTSNNDLGQPLILTPYIENGQIEEVRSLSKVGRLPRVPRNIPSYSGFITVNKTYNSNMFFWFFPAMNKNVNAPVILWLEGGPGASGLFSLFVIHGPYIILQDRSAELREFTWAKEYHVIYVDNPVGTGFSFTGSEDGYVTNEDEVADDLYEFLRQFFLVYYEYSKNDFYLIGESYAGKFVPSLAYRIHTVGPPAQVTFKGIAIGNGWCDPETQVVNYSDYFYQLGLIDRKQALVIRNVTDQVVQNIRNENYGTAQRLLGNVLGANAPGSNDPNYLLEFTGYEYPYFLLYTRLPPEEFYFAQYINLTRFRKAVHVGNLTFNSGEVVARYMNNDIMLSVKDILIEIMNNYKVLIYNGQLDLNQPYTLMVDFLHSIEWNQSDELRNADKKIWRLRDEIAGYVHNVGDFFLAVVRSAGHIVPRDQPEYALDLITRFINEEPYD
ncbi:probable serine carboxypeptidase CPVL [Trichonephila inaurata madagascariensis]|uniref:Carboxypeptidase n=1 Tax=Trichonephila inaurata madagascariensis TaxID=2747483 RepID=A0A8X6IL15_9ARAC|nr:probable serine carboxypeptidase CPVL [Trichonephila inaurata madagascariensis]